MIPINPFSDKDKDDKKKDNNGNEKGEENEQESSQNKKSNGNIPPKGLQPLSILPPTSVKSPKLSPKARAKQQKQRGMFSELLNEGNPIGFMQDEFVEVTEKNVQKSPVAKSYTRPEGLETKIENMSVANFNDPTVEPKIIAPYVTRPGQVPRKIEIERKKRVFASQDITVLLLEKGIDFSKPIESSLYPITKAVNLLPLDVFDNLDYEIRKPHEWIQLGGKKVKENGIPAKGLMTLANGTGIWKFCHVYAYNDKETKFEIRWDDNPEKLCFIYRLECCFIAEDPFKFSERLADAFRRRQEAEARILYNLYVDCMPTEGMKGLETEQASRILSMALNSRQIKSSGLDTKEIMNEANVQYLRTMNMITFDKSYQNDKEQSLMQDLKLPEPEPEKEPPAVGVIEVPTQEDTVSITLGRAVLEYPAHNFADKSQVFYFNSFLTRPEIIKVLIQCRTDCTKLLTSNFFTMITKCVRLEEFANLQQQSINALFNYIKDTWTANIQMHIRNNLKDMKKGWFNLEESSNEVYSFSKLKKFLMYINFIMQDSLRFLMEDSLHSYHKFILKACEGTVDIIASNKVTVAYPTGPQTRLPLFLVDIIVEESDGKEGSPPSVFTYSTPEPQFTEIALKQFDHAITSIQNITRIERRVMKKLFWSFDPVMHTVHQTESWVIALRDEMKEKLEESSLPLKKYLTMYDKYLEFIRLNVTAYMEDAETKYANPENLQVEALKALALNHLAAIEEIKADIPESISLGLFSINCNKVSGMLISKHQSLHDKLLDLLAKVTVEHAHELIRKFNLINTRLLAMPTDIEALTEMREYMETVPQQVGDLKVILDQSVSNFNLLESVKYKLEKSSLTLKWEVYGCPKNIQSRMEALDEELVNRKKKQLFDMEEEQEEFGELLKGLRAEVESLSSFTDLGRIDQVSAHVSKLKKDLAKYGEEAIKFNSREMLFDLEPTEYTQIGEISKTFEPYCDLWENADTWLKNKKSWHEDSFMTLDSNTIANTVTSMARALNKSTKFFEKQGLSGCLEICSKIKEEVEEFKPSIPLILGLRKDGMRERHWTKLSEQVGTDIVVDDALTLNAILAMGLADHIEKVNKISETAGKEYEIETTLDKMQGAWSEIWLVTEAYRATGTFILKEVDVYMALLDEHITLTQAMNFSNFKGPFEERIENWNKTLGIVSEVIDEWIGVQRNWLYLQPIFDSPDINKQLPTEGKRFTSVDKHWRQTMAGASNKALAIKFCSDSRLLERFRESNKLLEMVQKGLADYLETKRAGFSRFYFLSNDELLEILSQTKDPLAVQPHLKKCFEGIKSVTFQDDLTITMMKSSEGEEIPFVNPVDPKGKNIEVWMVELCKMMIKSVREQMMMAVREYPEVKRTDWMQVWPGQVVLNGSQAHWTSEFEALVDEKGNAGVRQYYEQLVTQLNDMVFLIRGDLSKMARITIGALAVIDVHARDVVLKMADNGVSSKNDFDWISQMRFYWIPEGDWEGGDLTIIMVQAKKYYGYEYLGNSFRLVITPLTDKCYLTIMGALQMILGGAPAGPAGTGKTETTKDLAKALAKQCVVFNCSDGLDYLAMGKFFKGLASSGAWACFDEFNRINIEVLSVIAQQIMTLQGAVARKEDRVIFEDTDIFVDPEFAVFITMNPGYAGRSALPDNLEALFRPVAMMVPDYALIGEIMLFSFGYLENRKCAKKMVATFRLCSEQLSSQDHYDYGMRAVKTVITAAGNLKRASPDEIEEALLLRALQDVNVPKFLSHDLPLFAGILSDLFPGIARPAFDYGPLLSAIKLNIEKQNLQAVPIFIRKVIELYEMICVRHGLMVVGPTGGGKSMNFKVLQGALTHLKKMEIEGERYEKVNIHHLNPKSISMGQLYGMFDENTHEWQDGILADLVRNCIRQADSELKWVLFDGPVDAIWIENMNTVLDDNKKLCLTSGEIMSLSEQMTMAFEPEDLAVASPATVSRCGMIYMEPTSLGFDVLIQSWTSTLPPSFGDQHKQAIRALFDKYVLSGLTFLRRFLNEPLPTVNNCLVQSLINNMDAYFEDYRDKEGVEPKTPEEIANMLYCMEAIFCFSYIWSIACTVDRHGRKAFDNFFRMEMSHGNVKIPIPADGYMYDYTFLIDEKKWVPWMETCDPYRHDSKASYSEMIIPTMDSVRYKYLLNLLILRGRHVLMTGPTGTGKTVNINEQLQKGFPDKYIPLCLSFSAQTGANQTQDLIDSKCEKRRKGIFGPTAGKKFLIFVDDVNMPQKEFYGAQPPIEILRQWFDNGGWYDRKELKFRKLIDIQLIAACGPPGGGRNPVSARFYRHFSIIGYTEMQDESMELIFGTILSNFVSTMDDSIGEFTNNFVKATINIYNQILEDLRPTPTKPHYSFNLRDISKVFQGMLMIQPKKDVSLMDFCKIWLHELKRVFSDRLINNADRKWLEDYAFGQLKEKLNIEREIIGDELFLLADFMVPGADPRIYEPIKNMDELQPTIEEYLQEYNADSKQPMNLVMFMDAIQHVARISRIIRQPKGNALLLGVGGSGRQSMTKLATFLAEYRLYQIEIAKGYGMVEWRENLKECLLYAGTEGGEGKPIVFLYNDTQIIYEQMLEDVNGILNAGDVPNIYAVEDLEIITTACKPDCVKKRLPPTKINIFAAYLTRVLRNIHIVLCMSPLGDSFRNRLRKFPSVVNCCTIDWFSEWPDEALINVARRTLAGGQMGLEKSEESCVSFVRFIHQTAADATTAFKETLKRNYYVTPTSYLELLSTYKSVLDMKRNEVGTLKNRLQIGLDKLITTANDVAGLQETLTAMEPELIKTQAEVNAMIIQIDKDKAAAAEVQVKVEAEEAVAKKKAAETKAIADDAQKDLDEALPALDEAVACLKDLKKADIDEVKSMSKPPGGVKITMHACCIMFNVKADKINDPDNPGKKILDYFNAGKKNLLSNAGKFMEDMQDYDKDNIPEKTIKLIEPFMTNPEFTPQMIEKASKACKAICMWCRAMYTYHQVSVMVEPKKKMLAEAQVELDEVIGALKVAEAKLKAVQDNIATLQAQFDEANNKKEELVKQVDECRGRLDRAQKLIGGLGGERTRWTESCKNLQEDYINLIGDTLLSSGMIAYSGAFTPEFRTKIVQGWQDELKRLSIPHTKDCDLRSTLADPVQIRQWNICGLPQDNHSTENAIIMSKARRYPLFIDPQGQANRFIKNMGKDTSMSENGLDVIKLSDKNFLRSLEIAIRFGRWVLLENVGEQLDAALEPLLLQQKYMQGGTEYIKLGDTQIPWNNAFRFFITTKLSNPHYPPEVCVKVSLLNFAITFGGLEDQLLGVVVVEEMPEMEQKKNALVVSNARMKKELQDIESKILYMLSNSKGNILDDVDLIETLASSKKTSQEITAKVAEAEITEKEIDETREGYRSVAKRGSILYFLVADLAVIDPMYQYSLQWFTNLFIAAIRLAEKSEILEDRLKFLNDYFTYYVYINICRSLFEKDKLLFSFIMTVKVLESFNEIDALEWGFLISGKTTTTVELENPNPDWIDSRMWTEVISLSTLPAFKGFAEDFVKHISKFREIYDSASPHLMPLPGIWDSKLNTFQKLATLRCIRADRVSESILNYVIEKMGNRFVEPPPFHLPTCFADSTIITPLIFVLSKGSDPTKAFFEFAAKMKFDKKVKGLSLGQGQGAKASRLIEDATQKGTWVYLQNCHLYISWLVELEFICENISEETCHKDFRLWLTSMPCKEFPVSILQNGVKMTNEPPKGLKANLRNAYFKLDNDKLNITNKPYEYKKLLFALVFFHACAQERRKFGPLGWNIPYEFNDTDLDISKGQLEIFLDSYDVVPYRVLRFLTSYINYGGRVTDYIDLRTIDVVMNTFYTPNLMIDGHKFDEEGLYQSIAIDETDPHAAYQDYIEKLPLVAGPGIFGLHENANITCALNETFGIFETILSLQASDSKGGGMSREELIGIAAQDFQEKVNKFGEFSIESISMNYPVKYEESMNTVLLQECIRYNKLIGAIELFLPQLRMALKGLVVMSNELEAMGNSIALNQVPGDFESVAYPSLKPLNAWVEDLVARLDFITKWVDDGIPLCFWISGFYFPQAFLTGSMQNYARKHQLPIDTIAFNFTVCEIPWENITRAPKDGVYIRGLFLEGARFDMDQMSIVESRPKQLYTSLPVLHLCPEQNRKNPTSGVYRCPIYKELSRRGVLSTTGHSTNFVMWIELPSKGDSIINFNEESDIERWIKAGVAAFCSLKF